MANVFKPKRSGVAASVPTTSNLSDGEIAVNSADKKIYLRDGVNILTIANKSISTYGIQYNFDTDTNSSDPGTGGLKFNFAVTSGTPGNPYEAYVSESDSNSVGIIGILDTLTESTNDKKALIVLYKEDDQSVNFKFYVTGQTDNGNYRTLNIEYIDRDRWNQVSDGDQVFFCISLIGDKGDDGGSTGISEEMAIVYSTIL